MLSFRGGEVGSHGGKVLSGSTSTKTLTAVSSSVQFASATTTLLSSSINNFDKQNVLGSIDPFLEHNKFEVDRELLKFTVTSEKPFDLGDMAETSIDNVESLFQDKRLSHVPNFLYLPPVNMATSEGAPRDLLGDYPRLGQPPMFDFYSLMKDLRGREYETVRFHKTSMSNNVVGQFFELGQTEFKKLDVIDFGEFRIDDPDFPEKHVFFVGKIFPDVKGMFTFVNMFTLIFE
jgi:hypothetical protein